MRLPGKGVPFAGSTNCFGIAEKSPLSISGVAVLETFADGLDRSFVPCQERKKNVLSFLTGPPTEKPYWFRFNPSSLLAKKLRPFIELFRRNSNAVPWRLFVPPRVT